MMYTIHCYDCNGAQMPKVGACESIAAAKRAATQHASGTTTEIDLFVGLRHFQRRAQDSFRGACVVLKPWQEVK